jgi:hypothetical protein
VNTKTRRPRTRSVESTATEFAHASAHGRVHDADLCDRIRELEAEVERLKADRHHCYGHWHWTGTPYYYPTWVSSGTTTTGKFYTTNSVTLSD